jgi:hypothetical protein
MSNKICLIYQPCGLGDILFIQKIANHWRDKGFKIIIPVVYELSWLNDYIKDVDFISWDDSGGLLTHKDPLPQHVTFPHKEKYNPFNKSEFTDDFVFINLFEPPKISVMLNKYEITGLEWEDWSDHLNFDRDFGKEDELFKLMGLNEGDDYVFINKNYQTRPRVINFDHISGNQNDYGGKKVIEMSIIDGYSLFDWLKVIEGASEIHMIESSLNYVLETKHVKLKADIMKLYSRHNTFCEVDFLFKLPWDYIIR